MRWMALISDTNIVFIFSFVVFYKAVEKLKTYLIPYKSINCKKYPMLKTCQFRVDKQ